MSLPVAGTGSMSDAGIIIRFRRSVAGAVAGAVLAGVVPGAILAMYMIWFPSLVVLLPVCGVPILFAAWSWRSRTDVTAHGLVIRGLLSVRRVGWADVSDLDHFSNGRIWARLISGGVVRLPVVRSEDLGQLRAVAAGSACAAKPTVVTRGGWGIAMTCIACYLALGLATWSVVVQRPAPTTWASEEIVMVKAGGWPYLFLYDCVTCSGPRGELSLRSDDMFTPRWFLLDAAILGALPAVALGAIGYRRRWFVAPRRPQVSQDAMKRPLKSVVIAVVAAAAITGGIVAVRLATSCRPDPDQWEIIEQFKADPIVAAAPGDGQLVGENLPPDTCIEWNHEIVPPPIRLVREYKVPAAYTLDQLHHLFDQPVAAGGWRLEYEGVLGDFSYIDYCKPIAGQGVAFANVQSTNYEGGSVLLNVLATGPGGVCDWMRHTSAPPS